MNWKTLVAVIAVSPFVALLGGVGVLAYTVSQTWDARNTDALICFCQAKSASRDRRKARHWMNRKKEVIIEKRVIWQSKSASLGPVR